MKVSEFVGYGDKMQQLMRSVQAGRIVHALLLAGPHGSGKRTMAELMARALVCTGADKPCGACPACKRFLAGTHPDVIRLAPEPKKKLISVEQVRDLIDAIALRPYEAAGHVVIIDQADRLSPGAQNALLKTLESPAGEARFFLITEAPGALLNTIRSRCQMVRFDDLSLEDCARVLVSRGISPERAALLSGWAHGSVGRALEIDGDGEYLPLRERVIASLEALKGPASVAAAAGRISEEKENTGRILDIMELWARDRMAVQAGAAPFQAQDSDRLSRFAIDGLLLLKGVTALRRELDSNVSWVYALENMYFRLVDGGTKERITLTWRR